ncbi:MAG: tRNA pseudouridine(55) synthase TruB [Hyphomicrobiales bacterium]
MTGKRARRNLHGWLVLDKPLGMSSTQALGRVRWLLGAEKAGHGGTLDPLASGVLPLAFGEATKTVSFAMDGRKTYRFTVQWGAETSTDDLEGEIVQRSNSLPALGDLQNCLPQFHGAVQQIPPSYSAIKISGQRAYALARQGDSPEMTARTVHIESLHIESHDPAGQTTFIVQCSKGTYVRAIARDLGRALGCLGHVVLLRRLAVGPFSEADAISLEKLEELSHRPGSENSLAGLLRPIETVLDGIPALAVMEPEARRLKQGQQVLLRGNGVPAAAEAVLVTHEGTPLGLFSVSDGVLKAIRLFNL